MDDIKIEQAKFAGTTGERWLDLGELPWSYGENRITVIVRDPDSAYVYWEITDQGIAAARARLGPAGATGWCNLRVYDTTRRDFDGTNANDYFDIGVDRADRDYYVMVRRPGSSMHAELGIKTHEGFFHPIARSGRADFPRNAPSPEPRLDWMTVTSDGAPPCAAPCGSRYRGPEPALPHRAGAGYVDVWRAAYPHAKAAFPSPQPGSGSWVASTTRQAVAHVERWWLLDQWRAEWGGVLRFLRGEHFDPRRLAIDLLGEDPERIEHENGHMTIFGRWRIHIHDVATDAGQRLLSTWSTRWVRATTPLIERWEQLVERRVVSEWQRRFFEVGASEGRARVDGGASEMLRLGGSERLWVGASEWMAGGASELLWLGASRFPWLGASESLGASERIGASEGLPGASESAPGSAGDSRSASAPVAEKWAARPEGSR